MNELKREVSVKDISPMRKRHPQVYAYVLKGVEDKKGWVKIGYTEKENVEDRIKEQVGTVDIPYTKLWAYDACYENGLLDDVKWFKDKDFHHFLRSKKNIIQKENREWFYYNGNPEKSKEDFLEFKKSLFKGLGEDHSYSLRKEQKTAVEMTLDYIRSGIEPREFLWNAKPRFGKTLTTYDLVMRLGLKKVLIVTNRPAIATSWFDDFKKFIEPKYKDYAFISDVEALKNKAITREEHLKILDKKPKQITFLSLQNLKGSVYFGGSFDKLDWIKDNKWDMLIIDEAHEAVDTIKTENAFDNIKRDFTLHLSGTPFKALASEKFNEDQIFNWTYQDEQEAKENWDKNNYFEENPYEDMPRLNMFSYKISDMIIKKVNKGLLIEEDSKEYAFDLNEFFSAEIDSKGKARFIYEEDVKKWLDTLTENEKYPFSTKELRSKLKHSLWKMNRINSAKAMKDLLESHKVFENYHVVVVAGDDKKDENFEKDALEKVRRAIRNHNKTITITVGKLTTGITVPQWSAVMMLSDMKSSAAYMQTIFRCQNPYKEVTSKGVFKKEEAYVFDFAPERTLIVYDEFANSISKKTSDGKGSPLEREENIKRLLNFFSCNLRR